LPKRLNTVEGDKTMRTHSKIILAASVSLALAFTFSCSSDDGDDNNGSGGNSGGSGCGTVNIGTQTWHKCNLNVVPSKGISQCYENKPENCAKYGRLYDWEAAMSACPAGFHLPTEKEWTALRDYAGGEGDAGEKLKAKSGWLGNGNGTDEFGFAALPGGTSNSSDGFTYAGYFGYWWSATEITASFAFEWSMTYNTGMNMYSNSKMDLYSVRCIKDN